MEQMEIEECDVCGGSHFTEACPELGLEPAGFEDAVVTRARLTLPHFLQAIDLPGSEVAIFSQIDIQAKTQFGPFEAKKTTHEFSDDGLFVLKILVRDGTCVSLDTTDENECNWMCLIRAATTQMEQNCIAYQLGTSIYYNTIKNISAGQELLVWYAPMFAKKLGKSETPDGVSRVMLNMKVIYPSVEELPESFPVSVMTQQNNKEHEVEPEAMEMSITNNEVITNDSQNKELEKANFKCKRCSLTFDLEQDLALHIMEHLSTSKPGNGRRGRPPKYLRLNRPVIQQNHKTSAEKSSQADDDEEEEENMENDDEYYHDDNDKEFMPKIEEIKVFEFSNGKRVQPKRHLKGRRTDGYMHDFVLLSSKEKESINKDQEAKVTNNEKQVVNTTETLKRGRGRPRKVQKVNQVTDNKERTTENQMTDHADSTMIKESKIVWETDETPCKGGDNSGKSDEDEKTLHENMSNRDETEIIKTSTIAKINDPKGDEEMDSSEMDNTKDGQSSEVNEWTKGNCTVNGSQIVCPVENIEEHENNSDILNTEQCNFSGESDSRTQVEMNVDSNVGAETQCESVTTIQQSEKNTETDSNTTNEVKDIILNGMVNEEMDKIDSSINETVVEDEIKEVQAHEGEGKDAFIEDVQTSDVSESDDPAKIEINKAEVKSYPGKKDRDGRTQKLRTQFGRKNHHVCKYCGKHFMNVNYLKLHLPRHTGKFQCSHCGFCYARKESLVKHKCKMKDAMPKIEHWGKLVYKCLRCKEMIEEREIAYQHFRKHGKEVECPECKQVFHRHQQMKDHNCPMAVKEVFECEICKQKFPHEKNLLRHMAMHTDIYKCKECSKTFARKDSLLKHVLVCCPTKAEEYKVFSCSKCCRGFSTKLGAENHETRCTKAMCTKCKRVYDSDEVYQRHIAVCVLPSNHNTSSVNKVKFTCSECGKSFRNLAYLNRHKEIHNGQLECFLCKKKFKVREEKDNHERFCMASSAINQVGEITCDCCDEVFNSAKNYREHYTVHTHPYSCEKCMKRFVKIGTLHTHSCTSADTKPVKCEICEKIFTNEKCIKLHMKTHRQVDFLCRVCDSNFPDQESYDTHMCVGPDGLPQVFVPSERKDNGLFTDKHVCHVCGRDFVSTSNLNKHMKIHGEKKVECKICSKKFHHEEYLKVHMEGVHEKKNKYQCSHCGKVLTSKPGLISHTRQFHSETRVAYSCPKCGKIFSQKGNMKTHMYSHTKERLFHCTFCPKTFKYPEQLNKHKLIHTMTDKLQCEICEKIFVKEYDLKKHTQTFHSGMMYVCSICNSHCGHKHTLYRHYKRKHPGDFHLMQDEAFVSSLFQHVNDVNVDSVKVENEAIVAIDYSGAEISTDSNMVSLDSSVLDGNTLPQVAAEALKSLSSTVVSTDIQTIDVEDITGDGGVGENTVINLSGVEGSYVQNLQQQITADGQTVVILQIMNPQDQEVQVQQIIEATEENAIQEGLPEEVQTWTLV